MRAFVGAWAAAALLAAGGALAQSEEVAEPHPYDVDYPAVGYTGTPRANPVARLEERLASGEATLVYEDGRGYLDSLLAALDIDPSSQTLVYSKSSLQARSIRASRPRALYFNDDVYVGWVQEGELIELAAMDAELGPVFYTLANAPPETPTEDPAFARELDACLRCHDSFSQTGGGVPRFMLVSSYVDRRGVQLTHEGRIITTDRTPLRVRWGGWFVTGRHGDQVHLGNMLIREVEELYDIESLRRGNLDSLEGLVDTSPYVTDTSDIVALMVLQHQTDVQNQITRVAFDVRTAMADAEAAGEPFAITEALREPLERLVMTMLFADAAEITAPIEGDPAFAAWFEAQGPRAPDGRSLRDLDLETRLLRHPLSWVVYSDAFDALPAPALDYVYGRFEEILDGRDETGAFDRLSAEDRAAVGEILAETKAGYRER